MRVTPQTENEIASANLWPAGEYDFKVTDAEEQQSSKGNDMVKLTVTIFDAEGNHRSVFDYLVSTPGGAYKIRHFADTVGLLGEYERGELLADDMILRVGRCKLNVQKDKSGQYPDKNGIADYIKPSVAAPKLAQRTKAPAGDIDDEVPF